MSEAYKDRQRGIWRAAAPGWDAWSAWYAEAVAPIAAWCVREAAVREGDRVLDVACGWGVPALALARAGGRVRGGDLSPEMLAVARDRAAREGLDVAFEVMDFERLPVADGAFDAITCAFGIMFCPDPAQAAAEARRVLRPGGRFAFVVWDEAARNPFFTTLSRRLAEHAPSPPSDPRAPGGFRFAPPGALDEVLGPAGFATYAVQTVPFEMVFESADHYLQIQQDCAPPVRSALASLSEAARESVRQCVRDDLERWRQGDRIVLPASALGASGTR